METNQPTEIQNQKSPRSSLAKLILWPLAGLLLGGGVLATLHFAQNQNSDKVNPEATAKPTLFEMKSPAVVRILNPYTGMTGTGFFVEANHPVILTNRHVVDDARGVLALTENDKGRDGWIIADIAKNKHADLAMLVVESSKGITPIKVEPRAVIKPGMKMFTIGYPLGQSISFQEGIVSSINDTTITFSAPFSQGGSGSPVLAENGNAVGVAFGYMENAQNHNLAIRVSNVWKKENWDRQTEAQHPTEAETESLKAILTAWIQKDESYTQLAEAHQGQYNEVAKKRKAVYKELTQAINDTRSLEKEIAWKDLSQKGDETTKMRALVKFLEKSHLALEKAEEYIAIESSSVTNRTLSATLFARSGSQLAQDAMRLVAKTENDTADQELKEKVAQSAQAYFQSKTDLQAAWGKKD